MRVILESGTFLGIAVGVHLLMAGAPQEETASSSAGEGGAAMMSLQASSESMEAMLEEWETPPEIETVTPSLAPVVETRPVAEITSQIDQVIDTPIPTLQLESALQNDNLSLPSLTPPTPVKAPEPPKPIEPPKPVVQPKPKPVTPAKPAPKPPTPQKTAPPRPQETTASAASQAQKAAGAGGQTSAGNSTSDVATAREAKAAARALARWHSSIRARIERRKKKAQDSGTVQLEIFVGRTGQLQSARVSRSSGSATLDQLALAAVRSAGQFPAAPKTANKAKYGMSFTMVFK